MSSCKVISHSFLRIKSAPVELEELIENKRIGETEKEVCNHLLNYLSEADYLSVYWVLKTVYPETVKRGSEKYLRVIVQHFIELVKKDDPVEALVVAQMYLAPFKERNVELQGTEGTTVKEVIGLLCYEDPGVSPLGFLLDEKCRKRTDEIVLSVLREKKRCFCKLDRLRHCLRGLIAQ